MKYFLIKWEIYYVYLIKLVYVMVLLDLLVQQKKGGVYCCFDFHDGLYKSLKYYKNDLLLFNLILKATPMTKLVVNK